MNARDTYWATLHDFKFKEYYLQQYCTYAKTLDGFLSGVSAVASAGSIAGWSVWSNLPWLWSLILILAQVIQVIRPLLPYGRRILAIGYMLPEMRKLAIEVQTAWLKTESAAATPPDYIALFHDSRIRFDELDAKYLGADALPVHRRLYERAEAETSDYLRLLFGASTQEGDDCRVKTTSANETFTKAL